MTWSRRFSACRECGTTKRKHKGLGLCTRCHQSWFLAKQSNTPSVRSRATITINGHQLDVVVLRRFVEDGEPVAACRMPSGTTIAFPVSVLMFSEVEEEWPV